MGEVQCPAKQAGRLSRWSAKFRQVYYVTCTSLAAACGMHLVSGERSSNQVRALVRSSHCGPETRTNPLRHLHTHHSSTSHSPAFTCLGLTIKHSPYPQHAQVAEVFLCLLAPNDSITA